MRLFHHLENSRRQNSGIYLYSEYDLIKRQFFPCRVFAMKSVQNQKSFLRSSQNCFVLALFSYTVIAIFLDAYVG